MGCKSSDALTYSAVIAVLMINLILMLWIKTACRGDSEKAEKED